MSAEEQPGQESLATGSPGFQEKKWKCTVPSAQGRKCTNVLTQGVSLRWGKREKRAASLRLKLPQHLLASL